MIHVEQLPNRLPEEKTHILVRRHWLIILKTIVLLGVAGWLPLMVYTLLTWQFPTTLHHPVTTPLLTLLASVYYLSLWMILFQEIIDYYLDTWIVTSERVVDVEQFGLFRRETTECHLASIVDVTSEMKGILQTVFKFGDVTVQTAGERGALVFKEVPHPESIRQLVLQLMQEDRARHERVATSSTPTGNDGSSTPS